MVVKVRHASGGSIDRFCRLINQWLGALDVVSCAGMPHSRPKPELYSSQLPLRIFAGYSRRDIGGGPREQNKVAIVRARDAFPAQQATILSVLSTVSASASLFRWQNRCHGFGFSSFDIAPSPDGAPASVTSRLKVPGQGAFRQKRV